MGMLQLAHSFLYDDQNACKEQAEAPHSKAFGLIFEAGNAVCKL
jgi:hypothetical protein